MKRRGALFAIIYTAGVILLLYVIQSTGWSRSDMAGFGKPLREIAWPVQEAASAVDSALRDFFGVFRSSRAIRTENEELRDSLAAAEYWIQQMKELREENLRLGVLLDFQTTHSRMFDLVTARVIGKATDNWNQTVILDKGSTSGLDCDMAVLAPAGMVGRIVAITPHTAEVLLLIDTESAIGARIVETRFSPGMVSGTGQDDLLEMMRVDHETEVLPGQTVITSGFGSVFPQGLMIGTVTEVLPDTNGLTKRATIRPAVDFRRLEEVMVIRGLRSDGDSISDDVVQYSEPPDLRIGR
ncbi:MAG: rod shape-determining protein MreC [Clostridiales bacterium]|nr:rod shape-determining protein MreC [Clostridiales bacterium]